MSFNLRDARMDSGLTILELAAKTGVSRSTLIRLEQGGRPTAPTAKRVAEWVGVSASELWPHPLESSPGTERAA